MITTLCTNTHLAGEIFAPSVVSYVRKIVGNSSAHTLPLYDLCLGELAASKVDTTTTTTTTTATTTTTTTMAPPPPQTNATFGLNHRAERKMMMIY
jgi:hypothetical protein